MYLGAKYPISPKKLGNFALINIKDFSMVSISIEYSGDLRCIATHDPSGNTLFTDAPIDNNGKGASFSPTDLLATALGTCIMTIMGIAANKRAIDITGTTVHVKKIMVNEPIRRIGALEISIALPKQNYSDGDMAAFHHAAKSCPVMMSIHPEIDVKYNLSVVE
jgi:putative redox protein